MNPNDEQFLKKAIEIAQSARDTGDAPFGSLLVDQNGTILMTAHNTVLSERDISAHPEFKIARWAARELNPIVAAETTLFTSCQPCEMCSGAIDRSGIGRVVYALSEAQLSELRGHSGYPRVQRCGPYLYDIAARPLYGYYATR